jgi:hypothetical protein
VYHLAIYSYTYIIHCRKKKISKVIHGPIEGPHLRRVDWSQKDHAISGLVPTPEALNDASFPPGRPKALQRDLSASNFRFPFSFHGTAAASTLSPFFLVLALHVPLAKVNVPHWLIGYKKAGVTVHIKSCSQISSRYWWKQYCKMIYEPIIKIKKAHWISCSFSTWKHCNWEDDEDGLCLPQGVPMSHLLDCGCLRAHGPSQGLVSGVVGPSLPSVPPY